MGNTKKAVAKKSSASTVKKAVQKPKKDNAEKVLEQSAPVQKGDTVLVSTSEGLESATVIAVHGGNRVEVVVNGPKPYSPGTLKHKNDANVETEDFWLENNQ